MDESLAVIFYVVFVNTMTSESFFFSDKPGKLTPTDYYLFVGEQLNMTCKLTDSTVSKGDNSSMLYFTYGNDIPIPEEDTFIISRSSKGFTHTIDSVFDRPYHCNFNTSISITKITFVDSTMVTAEYYPRPVTNFNCIIYDWDEKMECSWDLGVNYFNIKYISTNLTLGYSGVCPGQRLQLTNCTWLKSDRISFDRSQLSFNIEVTNTKKDVTVETGWITISQNDYVKPSPVESLNIQSYTSTWVVLKWSHKRTHRLKYFIINLKSKWGDDKKCPMWVQVLKE